MSSLPEEKPEEELSSSAEEAQPSLGDTSRNGNLRTLRAAAAVLGNSVRDYKLSASRKRAD
jgi:hypothetical protein